MPDLFGITEPALSCRALSARPPRARARQAECDWYTVKSESDFLYGGHHTHFGMDFRASWTQLAIEGIAIPDFATSQWWCDSPAGPNETLYPALLELGAR